ncbi:MAG TPA: phage tail protein [Rhodocyclaceae bacterium]|nr:phage tail protein [Rhodocyclaceae bacterium]
MSIGERYYTPWPFDVSPTGVPLAGSQLFFYETGTSTPLDTWSDVTLTTANPNPVVAGSDGHFGPIFLTPATAYKVAFYGANPDPGHPSTPSDPQGTLLRTADPVGPAAGGATSNTAGIVGEVRAFAGIAAAVPAQWALCYGQAVSRTTYSAAFSALGTTWGAGNGSTTFNLPDLRGRVLAGVDNMGGSAADRITTSVSGIAGTSLGATGGDQNAAQDTLTAETAVTITDPGHTHPTTTTGAGLRNAGSDLVVFPTKTDTSGSNVTGITAAATTMISGTFVGTAQNVQPTAMVNFIIYLAA